MHAHFLDPYRPGQSPIHRLDPRVKFILTLAFILTVALVPPGAWQVYILLIAIIFSVEILSEIGISYFLKRALLAIPFVLAALPVIFTMPGNPLISFQIGHFQLTISDAGLVRFISIALKSWISIQAAIVLTVSTPFPDLLLAMRAVRIPRLLVAIFSLMWRYLFVFSDEVLRLRRARVARSGFSPQTGLKPGGSLSWRARVTGGMAGNLFLRAIERSDRIYLAMLSRGYDGEVRAAPLPSFSLLNRLILGIGIVVLLMVFSLALL
jgi:cobalt/nickel transport system permease protein